MPKKKTKPKNAKKAVKKSTAKKTAKKSTAKKTAKKTTAKALPRSRAGKAAVKPKVIIRACDTYDPEKIEAIILDGLRELDLSPHGNTLVKPNIVASGDYFPHAYTRPEFMDGVLGALKTRAAETNAQVDEWAVGERCGITVPTRFAFREANYPKMLKRRGFKQVHFEEVPQVEIPLYHKERLRDSFFTPETVAKADFFVNTPKFKAHPWTTVTFSLKSYIGIQDDRHRLIDHDHRLNEKVADLQYIIQPQFIAIDAITAGEGRMLTPIPFDMGLIIMGNNQVAFDAVCCNIIGLNPKTVDHIYMAHKRGFGPIQMNQIKVTGDVTLAQAKKKAKGFRTGLIRVEDYFKDTNIKAYAGPPPDHPGEKDAYCWGGCPGAIEESIEILRLFDDKTDEKMPPTHIVFGNYKGDIPAKPDEKVVFIGDCSQWKGELHGREIEVKSQYVHRADKSPYDAKHQGVYGKLISTTAKMKAIDKSDYMRLGGCPVSVAEQTLALVHLGKLKNPYFDKKQVFRFNHAYLGWRGKMLIKKLGGVPYQVKGATHRGQARPEQNLPTDKQRAESKLEK